MVAERRKEIEVGEGNNAARQAAAGTGDVEESTKKAGWAGQIETGINEHAD